MIRDLRLAARVLARQKGLSLSVILTLGIGIAVATTAFSVVNAALLRQPAGIDTASLVNLYTTRPDGTGYGASSYPDFQDFTATSGDVFAGVFGFSGLLATWNHDGRADALFGELVTGSYFGTLGISPADGRWITPDDDRDPGQHAVVVIGHRFWRERLGGDPMAVGRAVVLNGRTYTIVGIAPASFTGLLFRGFAVDVWAPSAMMGQLRTDQLQNRGERWLFARARLRPGVTADQAGAALDVVAARLARDHADTNQGRQLRVVPSRDVWISPDADGPLRIVSALLVGACVVLLLVGLSNVLGLLIARMVGRQRDFAVQLSLGASRAALGRQLLAEALLLGASGGVLGLLVASAIARALSSYRPPLPVPLAFDVAIDVRVALFAVLLTIAVSALAGLALVRRLARRDVVSLRAAVLAPALQRSRRHWLLVPQVAGSLVLLVVAALLTRSVAGLAGVSHGFDERGVGMVTFNPGTSGLSPGETQRFFDDLLSRTRAAAGVAHAALADRIPLDLYGSQAVEIVTEARETAAVQVTRATENYFEALGIPARAGRLFTPADVSGGAPVAVVSDAFARRFFPGASAVGQVVTAGGTTYQIAGVAADAAVQSPGEAPAPMLYLPLRTPLAGLIRVVVKTSGDVTNALAAIVRNAAAIRPEVALFERRTMAEHLALTAMPFKAATVLASALGAIALGLTAIGLHGLVAFAVASRRKELGIRLALGASAAAVIRTAARSTIVAVAVGIALGGILAAAAAGALSGFLFGVASFDPLAFGGAAIVLALSVAAAVAGPLRRVFRTSVSETLRQA